MLELYTKINSLPKKIANNLLGLLEDSDEQEKYLEGLNKSLQASKNEKIYYIVFPILVQLLEDLYDNIFAKFISNVRAVSMCKSPIKLTEQELKNYLDAVFKMTQYYSNDINLEFVKDFGLDLPTAINNLNIGFLYLNNSTDSLGIFYSQNYYEPIPVKCMYCGHEVQKFNLIKEKIKPTDFTHSLYNRYIMWRIIGLENLELENVANDMHLLYGTFRCKKCKKKISPIKANSYHYLSQHDYQPLTLEQIKKIHKLLLSNFDLAQENFYKKLVVYGEYISNLYWDNLGYDCMEPYPMLQKIATTLLPVLGEEFLRITIETSTMVINKYKGKDTILQAGVCFSTGRALGEIYEKTLDESITCVNLLEMSKELYLKELGESSTSYLEAKLEYLVEKAKYTETEEDINNLLNYFDSIKTVSGFKQSSIDETGHRIAEIIGIENPKLAVELESNYYKSSCRLAGEDNVALTDNRIDLALLYIKNNELEKALELLEKNLKILTTELGGQKVLTAVLNNNVDKLKEKPNNLIIEFIAKTMVYLGNIYIEKNLKKSIKINENAIKLYQFLPISYVDEICNAQMVISLCYTHLDDKSQALKYIKIVIKTYKDILRNNEFEEHLDVIREQLSIANNLFKVIKMIQD